MQNARIALSVSSFCLLLNGFSAYPQSSVVLHRKLPALFHLTGTEVSVRVVPTAQGSKDIADELRAFMETKLAAGDHRITINNEHPQTVIACEITSYIPPASTRIAQTQTPQSTLHIPFGKKNSSPPEQITKVTGNLALSYRATEPSSGKNLDAAVLESKVDRDYGANGAQRQSIKDTISKIKDQLKNVASNDPTLEQAPTPAQIKQEMITKVASDLVSRVVNTDESVTVSLASGKEFEEVNKLAQSKQWPAMLEKLSSIQAPQDQPSLFYETGVAYEAEAYEAPSPEKASKLADEAVINYGKAADAKPESKRFRESRNRIEQALVVFSTLAERAKNEPTAAAEDALTDDSLIDLKKAGMDDDNLIATIQDANHVKFDLSVAGLKQLTKAGISGRVLAAMRQKNKGSAPAHSSHP